MVKYTGINHLAMVTADLDKTIRFWRDLLGLRMVVSLGRKGYRQYFFEISKTDLIAFFEWPEVGPVPEKDHGVPVKGPVAFDHVSIGVDTLKDLLMVKEKLSAADFWVSEIIDHGFIYSIYSFDPNNIPVEFSYCVPAVDIRAMPKLKDRSPTDIALEGPDPQQEKWPQPMETDEETEEEIQIYPGEGATIRDENKY